MRNSVAKNRSGEWVFLDDKNLEKQLRKWFPNEKLPESAKLVFENSQDRVSWFHDMILHNKHQILLFRFLCSVQKPQYFPEVSVTRFSHFKGGTEVFLNRKGRIYNVEIGHLFLIADECFRRGVNYAREEIEALYKAGRIKTLPEYIALLNNARHGGKFKGKRIPPKTLLLYKILDKTLEDPAIKLERRKQLTINRLCRKDVRFKGQDAKKLRNAHDWYVKHIKEKREDT